jgi:ribosomal protein S18 acetylase RimI-like enzyme
MHKNGYVKLPPGKLANAVTWLEIVAPRPAGVAPPGGMTLRKLGPADAALFHRLYRDIGRDWLWSAFIAQSEAEIAARLGRADILSCAAQAAGELIGMLDMEITAEGLEIVNFGFAPAFTGKGAGAWLMDEAKRLCAEAGVPRLWLHTCNHDHPKALAFYRRQGFHITAVGYEVMDDPRASGLLPRDAAPHVPLAEG